MAESVDSIMENIKARVETIEKDVEVLKLDVRESTVKSIVVQETLKRVDENIVEIKKSIDKGDSRWEALKEQRDKDHLESPRKRFDNLLDKIVYLVVGAIVTYLLTQAFPFLPS